MSPEEITAADLTAVLNAISRGDLYPERSLCGTFYTTSRSKFSVNDAGIYIPFSGPIPTLTMEMRAWLKSKKPARAAKGKVLP